MLPDVCSDWTLRIITLYTLYISHFDSDHYSQTCPHVHVLYCIFLVTVCRHSFSVKCNLRYIYDCIDVFMTQGKMYLVSISAKQTKQMKFSCIISVTVNCLQKTSNFSGKKCSCIGLCPRTSEFVRCTCTALWSHVEYVILIDMWKYVNHVAA